MDERRCEGSGTVAGFSPAGRGLSPPTTVDRTGAKLIAGGAWWRTWLNGAETTLVDQLLVGLKPASPTAKDQIQIERESAEIKGGNAPVEPSVPLQLNRNF